MARTQSPIQVGMFHLEIIKAGGRPGSIHVGLRFCEWIGKMERSWFQVSLMTGVVWMFIAGGIVYLNLLPIWHYAGEANGEEVFENTGFGWPFQIYSTGLFYGPFKEPAASFWAAGGNMAILILVLLYFRALCEWRLIESRVVKRGIIWSTVLGLVVGCFCFVFYCLIADGPVFSPVSFSIGFKPWWQNWRSASVVAMGTGIVVGCIQLLRSLVGLVGLEDLRRFWRN